jgi:hypothetical protein
LADFLKGVKMNKIYFIAFIGAMLIGAYFYGANISDAKCRARQIQDDVKEIQLNEQIKKEIHDKVYKTGVVDIRRILHDKYTIAE